jgi:hypothetical protein
MDNLASVTMLSIGIIYFGFNQSKDSRWKSNREDG